MDNKQTADNGEKLYDLIKGERFVMFTTVRSDGTLVSRPMTIAEREDNVFRFVTQADNEVSDQSDGQQVNLSIMNGSDYISLSGVGRVENDLAKKKELWNRIQEAYAGDAEDPSNVILEVTADGAEYWDGGNTVSMLIGLAKAAVTGDRPEGEHGTVEL